MLGYIGKAAKTRRKCATPLLLRDHLMYTRCPAIHAALEEKRRRKAEENDLSSQDR
jgi:hypothetical protein